MPSANFLTEFYRVDNTGVVRPATDNDLEAVGASGHAAPPSIKEEHRAAKRAEARADGDAGRDAAGDAVGAGEDAMDVDGSPNRNPNGNRNLPSRRIHFD